MYVGKKIKQLRQTLELTQEAMANELEVSRQHYIAIETGKKEISNKMLSKIHQKWNVETEFFNKENSISPKVYIGGFEGGKVGGFSNLVEGVDYVVGKDGSWLSKGSKLDKFITQAGNVAIIDNLVNEKATPKIVRLMKLEVLLVKNDIIPKKPLLDDFKLVLDALSEMQSKFLSDDNEEIISQESIIKFEKATELLDNVFFKNFDLLFKEKNPESKIQNIVNYEDLLSYWAAGEHKKEW